VGAERPPAKLTVHVEGPSVRDHCIPLDDLVLLGRHLQATVDRVGRVLLGQTTSVRKGRRPREVRRLCSLRVSALRSGSITLTCELPPQTEPTLFGHLGEETLVALVNGMDAVGKEQASLPRGYDRGVLLALRETGELFNRGIDHIDFALELKGRSLSSAYTPEIHARVISRIREPVVNRCTVRGRLLMGDFKETGYRCRLHPPFGNPIQCTFSETEYEAVLSALTKHVEVVGEATERDGVITALRIEDIAILGDADEGRDSGAPLPEPSFDTPTHLLHLAEEQGVRPASDFESLLGDFWPEDENVDEFIG